MSLSLVLDSVAHEVQRHAAAFSEGRERHPALAPYESAAQLLAALSRTSRLDDDARDALLVCVVTEAQRGRSPLWQSILLAAFAPLLRRLRARLRRPKDEDLDQLVLVSFLDLVRSTCASSHVARVLRLNTERAVFTAVYADRAAPRAEELDEEAHATEALGVDPHASANAAEVVRMIEAEGGEELLDMLLATRAGDESLDAYVARTYASRTQRERDSEYGRLLRARQQLERKLQKRMVRAERRAAA